MSESLEVWLDADFLPERLQVGMLSYDRGAVRFSYEPVWLKHLLSFALDPQADRARFEHCRERMALSADARPDSRSTHPLSTARDAEGIISKDASKTDTDHMRPDTSG
jgi:hypothetical protein